MSELPNPVNFDAASKTVRKEDVVEQFACGPDVGRHLEVVQQFVDAGFDHVVLMNAGPDPDGFLDFFERELAEPVRALTPSEGVAPQSPGRAVAPGGIGRRPSTSACRADTRAGARAGVGESCSARRAESGGDHADRARCDAAAPRRSRGTITPIAADRRRPSRRLDGGRAVAADTPTRGATHDRRRPSGHRGYGRRSVPSVICCSKPRISGRPIRSVNCSKSTASSSAPSGVPVLRSSAR